MAAALAAALTVSVLAACGGGGGSSDTANVRLVNATTTHASLSLLANSSSVITATALDSASNYVGVDTGSPALQLNDGTTGTALATTAPSISKDQHYTVVAYESGGVVRTAVVGEDTTAPASGTTYVRFFDLATDAGGVDIYVTDPATDISTLSSPTVSFATSTSTQATNYLSFTPGTYRVRVTGAGNTADIRLDIPSVTLVNQQLVTTILSPTTGGTLVNGSLLVQQGAYTAARNTSARVRLAAAVANNALVSASTSTAVIATSSTAPSVSGYAIVQAGAALAITVNGATVAAPTTALAAGSDSTLLVYGNPGSAVATLVADDNHLPAVTTNLKLRLFNGVTGAATTLSATANFGVIATNIAPAAASTYTDVPSSTTTTHLEVSKPSGNVNISPYADIPLPANAVYTLFVLGDAGAPVALLRRDR